MATVTVCAPVEPGSVDAPGGAQPCRPAVDTGNGPAGLLFTDLPLEIRLQIYNRVLEGHLFSHRPLASWVPVPDYGVYRHEVVVPAEECGDGQETQPREPGGDPGDEPPEKAGGGGGVPSVPSPQLLSPHRPFAYMPSSLLRTCRQVYHEARQLAFWENEFVFVSWFASGMGAAAAFTRGLEPWQRESMRYVRLEAWAGDLLPPPPPPPPPPPRTPSLTSPHSPPADLVDIVPIYPFHIPLGALNCAAAGKHKLWEQLCTHWSSSLRGLRLRISAGAGGGGCLPHGLSPAAPALERAGAKRLCAPAGMACGCGAAWVDRGLRRLARLRFLEIELADTGWSGEQKASWCAAVGERLNGGRGSWEEGVSVICVQRARGEGEPPREKR